MGSPGGVELALAVILLRAGVFNTEIFTVVPAVGLVTTIIFPVGGVRYRQAGLCTRMPACRGGPPVAGSPNVVAGNVAQVEETPLL